MHRTRLAAAIMLATSTLVTVGASTIPAEAATPTAVYSSVSPSRPMVNEKFLITWRLSTSFTREARLQTLSSGSWKTIAVDSAHSVAALYVRSSKTRQYRVYVPKTIRNGRTYPSYASPAKTLRVFAQTANAFATPNEQCGTAGENVPVTLVAQFEPRRSGRSVTFTSVGSNHPAIAAKTDNAGNVAVQVQVPLATNQDFQTTVTAESFNGSVSKTVVVSYRTVENHCSWFQ